MSCVHDKGVGKLVSETGSAMVARGVLDAASLMGDSCPDRVLSGARGGMDCGGRTGSNPGADAATVGMGAARAALGIALMAITGAEAPQSLWPFVRPEPTHQELVLTQAGQYRIVGKLSARPEAKRAACAGRFACRSVLDPRNVELSP